MLPVAITYAEDVIQTASLVGGPSDDEALTGAAIQSDGTIVLAGNLGPLRGDGYRNAKERALGRLDGDISAAVLLVSGDGKQLLAITRLPGRIHDLALDGSDAIYLAAGDAGLIKLSPSAGKVIWSDTGSGPCTRVDAAITDADSDVAAFFGTEESTGNVLVKSSGGKTLGSFKGHQKTKDLAIDPRSRRVFLTGFKNDRGNGTPGSKWANGAPVQVAYLLARDYGGSQIWKAYDWPGKQVGYIDGGLSSMADTRGLRVTLGQDGKLYAAFMAAGGDHIFRYDGLDFGSKARVVGGDKFSEFYNSASEHKGLYGQFDPGTGKALAIQQFTARLDSGKANTAWSDQGAIAADEQGRIYATGKSASGLPLSWDPWQGGAYTGGGFLVIWSPGFADRLACVRLGTSGELHAVAVRKIRGRSTPTVVFAGHVLGKGEAPQVFVRDGLQDKAVSPGEAVFGVIGPRVAAGELKADGDAPSDDADAAAPPAAGSDNPHEVKARANLEAAQRLLERGDEARARDLLRRLIRQWPDTPAAAEARGLLGE